MFCLGILAALALVVEVFWEGTGTKISQTPTETYIHFGLVDRVGPVLIQPREPRSSSGPRPGSTGPGGKTDAHELTWLDESDLAQLEWIDVPGGEWPLTHDLTRAHPNAVTVRSTSHHVD